MALNLARQAERIPRSALVAMVAVLLGGGVLAAAATTDEPPPPRADGAAGSAATTDTTTSTILGIPDTSAPAAPGAPPTSPTSSRPAAPGTGGPGTSAAPQEAQARIAMKDPGGAPRTGIPLIVEGPVTRRFVSGPDGVAAVTAPAGRYTVKVPEGCFDQLHVTQGATGALALAEGQVASGQLTVGATLRYVPTKGTSYQPQSGGSPQVGWRPGEVHVVQVAIRDRCRQPIPEGTVLDRGRFEPGEGVELVGPPTTRADASGRISVSLRCVRDDTDVALALVEPDLPTDRHEVLTRENLDEAAPPYCRA